ncbi:hypothetical protein EHO61_01760 [Leptospira fluminis]|uniref:SH3 domain-containing protein n=1 Tax=Leptospira fluminis TaxID=2484979 RepID=A0A4V3JEX8_9LEPT|nr:hypothetical protein [Leptospira fluminis]TGK21985.1 hypothetical protein EHO61_01760 [Leptospira fluminis]
MKYFKHILYIGLVICSSGLFAQEDIYERDCFSEKNNVSLKQLKNLRPYDEYPMRMVTSSSAIKANGMSWSTSYFPNPFHRPLAKTRPKGDRKAEVEWVKGTCNFTAFRVQDKWSDTFWCTAEGLGVGEVVASLIDLDHDYFQIIPGYYQGEMKGFLSYSRPHEIDVHYLVPKVVGRGDGSGTIVGDFVYLGKQRVELPNKPGYQKIQMRNYKEILDFANKNKKLRGSGNYIVVAIEFISIYEGNDPKLKEHTCVSEITNFLKDSEYEKYNNLK